MWSCKAIIGWHKLILDRLAGQSRVCTSEYVPQQLARCGGCGEPLGELTEAPSRLFTATIRKEGGEGDLRADPFVQPGRLPPQMVLEAINP